MACRDKRIRVAPSSTMTSCCPPGERKIHILLPLASTVAVGASIGVGVMVGGGEEVGEGVTVGVGLGVGVAEGVWVGVGVGLSTRVGVPVAVAAPSTVGDGIAGTVAVLSIVLVIAADEENPKKAPEAGVTDVAAGSVVGAVAVNTGDVTVTGPLLSAAGDVISSAMSTASLPSAAVSPFRGTPARKNPIVNKRKAKA